MQPTPFVHDGKWYIVSHYRGEASRSGHPAAAQIPPKVWSQDRKKWVSDFALATAFSTEVEVWNHLNAYDVPKP
jgi:hypothetical protein